MNPVQEVHKGSVGELYILVICGWILMIMESDPSATIVVHEVAVMRSGWTGISIYGVGNDQQLKRF